MADAFIKLNEEEGLVGGDGVVGVACINYICTVEIERNHEGDGVGREDARFATFNDGDGVFGRKDGLWNGFGVRYFYLLTELEVVG